MKLCDLPGQIAKFESGRDIHWGSRMQTLEPRQSNYTIMQVTRYWKLLDTVFNFSMHITCNMVCIFVVYIGFLFVFGRSGSLSSCPKRYRSYKILKLIMFMFNVYYLVYKARINDEI